MKFVKTFERKTKEDRITIVNTGCNEGVNENGSAARCKRWAKTLNVA